MFVGPERVGKTSLTKALTGQAFDDKEEITDGIETSYNICVKHITNWTPKPTEGNEVQLVSAVAETIAENIWRKRSDKKSQQPQFPPMQPSDVMNEIKTYFGESGNVSTHASKFDQATTSHSLKLNTNDFENLKEVVKRIIDILKKKDQQEENEESGETDDELTISTWDFAGQDLYYITHQVFLVSRAIYILCFNLCDDTNIPAKRFKQIDAKTSASEHHMRNMDFWLRSIYSHTTENPSESNQVDQLSPSMFIVGTHRESLPGTNEERKALVDEKLAAIEENLIQYKPYEGHVVSKYYAIDNSLDPLDPSIIELRDHITKVAKEEHYMGQKVPLKWLAFLQEVERLRKETNTINFKEVKELARTCGVTKTEHLFTMLHFHHDLGHILYYGERTKQGSALNDIVILKPIWLIGIFRTVFTVKKSSKRHSNFRAPWRTLENKGILEERLLRHMLKDFLAQLESILELMQKFDLLCVKINATEHPLARSAKKEHRLFYAPSLLKKNFNNTVSIDSNCPSVVMLYIDFKEFLPEGLFNQFLVRLVHWSQEQGSEPELFYQQANLYVDEDHSMIVRIMPQDRSYVQVAIIWACEDKQQPNPSTCKLVLNVLKENLLYLKQTWMKNIEFEFCIQCDNKKKKKTHYHGLDNYLSSSKTIACGVIGRVKTKMVKHLFGDVSAKQGFSSFNNQENPSPAPLDDTNRTRPPTETEECRYRDFLSSLSDDYDGTKYKSLRCLLYDHLPISELSSEDKLGMHLFNKLDEKGRISYSNVKVLLEMAETTEEQSAITRIHEYMHETGYQCNVSESSQITHYRKALYRSLTQVAPGELPRVIAHYNLSHQCDTITDIWDLVHHLEVQRLLDHTPMKMKRFAKNLNGTARGIFQGTQGEEQPPLCSRKRTMESTSNEDEEGPSTSKKWRVT